jgi:AraC-like DNA-binding protein
MERTTDLASFADAPVGRALLGETWMHFCAHAGLFGVVLWGRPNREQTAALVRSLAGELGDGVPPHRSLVDAGRIDGVDGGAFEQLRDYVVAHTDALSRAVTRLALVRPSGLPGAVTSGFYTVSGSPYPVEVFETCADALAWLEEDAGLAATLDALVHDACGTSALRARLRTVLTASLQGATLGDTARALNMSDRTLQRRLKQEGTTFANELLEARLADAQRRIRDTDEALATIAIDTGFASQQHLSTAFKKATGEQPSAWRKRLRGDHGGAGASV